MLLELLGSDMDAESWEKLCDSCLRLQHGAEHFTKIPAGYEGDGGIEGYTQAGIVYQCYYPMRSYTDDELYDHLRDKMRKDIGKLLDFRNGARLKEYGVPTIKEWWFITPEYRDPRILKRKTSKELEVRKKVNENPDMYDYISPNFKIYIKVAEDFKIEISQLIRTKASDVKLNLDIRSIKEIDMSNCESEKVENVKRKVKALMGEVSDDDEDFQYIVDGYIKFYLKGIELINYFRINFPDLFEDITAIESAYKEEVELKTRMNMDSSLNKEIFESILNEFECHLEKHLHFFDRPSILALKNDLVAKWLADCSMQFRSRK